ncbi:MAG: RluA family pseudouridine synthase [Bacteriovoracaceae bacterium]|nr:RluA family pseudouridine synthase [Bacteriovoracaceae bacterium]
MSSADTNEVDARVLTVTEADKAEYRRLDLWLAAKLDDLSRTTIKRLYEDGNITTIDGRSLSLSKMPQVSTEIEIEVPPPITTELVAQNIPLDILFEDEHLIIIVKPAGLCVHPAPGHPDQTLVNAILYHCPNLKGIGGEKRPGIVHRLDLGTSGVMVVAKTQEAHEGLVQLFSRHDIERAYETVMLGTPKMQAGKIETFIGRHPQHRQKMSCLVKSGKKAISHFKILKSSQNLQHAEFRLETGRTHQIRVHASQFLNAPVLCDPLYADVNSQMNRISEEMKVLLKDWPHQLLHAKILGFKHPISGEALHFESPLPTPMKEIINLL